MKNRTKAAGKPGAAKTDGTKSHSSKRRTLLAAIAMTGAAKEVLPHKWSRPVVDALILPAHAQASPNACQETSTIDGFRLDFPTPSITLPFTGTIGEIPPSTQTPVGSNGAVRWFYTVSAVENGATSVIDNNSCQTVTRGSSPYTIPLLVPSICNPFV
jgi:hypothetical protein